MVSSLVLEQPGKWRRFGVSAVFLIAILPALPLLIQAFSAPAQFAGSFVGSLFGEAFLTSILMAFTVSAAALVVGLPTGVLTALYEFPARPVLLSLCTLPLLVPTFLWSIGWSSLAAHLGPRAVSVSSGFSGCILIFTSVTIPLVLLSAYASARSLSSAQIDAARLAGGERAVLLHSLRHVVVPSALAAAMGGVLTLSDPGPGQILGLRTVAAEILTSFSSFYDFALAARQCFLLAGFILIITVPLSFFAAPRLAREVLSKQPVSFRRLEKRSTATIAAVLLTGIALCGTIIPLAGLGLSLRGGGEFIRALSVVGRTAGSTLVYAAGAGIVAGALGLALAVCVGRDIRLLKYCLGISFILFAFPAAFAALGIVRLAAEAPAWTDPFLRSRLTVCLALGLRFLPVAALLSLRAWGSTSTSWTMAAGLHGVSLTKYLFRVVLPLLVPAGAVVMLLVALLATADITTVLLLHPPGQSSLPLAIFTVMANSPESLVASLCLVYITAAGGLLTAFWWLSRRG